MLYSTKSRNPCPESISGPPRLAWALPKSPNRMGFPPCFRPRFYSISIRTLRQERNVPAAIDDKLRLFLAPAEYVDSDHPAVRAKAAEVAAAATDPVETARRLYGAVRDGIRYDPYVDY